MVVWMLALALGAAAPHPPKIAVLDVEDTSGVEAARAKMLTQVLSGELPKMGRFQVVTTSEIRSMIGFEKQKQLLGCKEDSCLAELGGALGVDYLVTTQLAKFGSRYRLDLRLLDARKSRAAASEGEFIAGNDDALAEAAVEMLHKLISNGHLAEPEAAAASTTEPAGGLTQTAPPHRSRTAAWVVGGAAVVLAGAAVGMTLYSRNTFNTAVQNVRQGHSPDDASLAWSSPLADSLWAGAAICAGVSTYLFLRPAPSGSGGAAGVGGSF